MIVSLREYAKIKKIHISKIYKLIQEGTIKTQMAVIKTEKGRRVVRGIDVDEKEYYDYIISTPPKKEDNYINCKLPAFVNAELVEKIVYSLSQHHDNVAFKNVKIKKDIVQKIEKIFKQTFKNQISKNLPKWLKIMMLILYINSKEV